MRKSIIGYIVVGGPIGAPLRLADEPLPGERGVLWSAGAGRSATVFPTRARARTAVVASLRYIDKHKMSWSRQYEIVSLTAA